MFSNGPIESARVAPREAHPLDFGPLCSTKIRDAAPLRDVRNYPIRR